MMRTSGESKLRMRYVLTLVTGLVECLCFAGILFGFASLVFVLKTDEYFEDMCVSVAEANGTTFKDCSAQDEQFSLIFTIASFMNNFITFPNGFLFDRYGTRVTRLLSVFLYTIGTLMVALSSKALSVLLFPALSFIAVGGIMLLLTNMQVGNLFASRRATVITLYSGAFDSSSSVFFIVKVLHENGISLRASFLFLSACGIIHLLRTLFLMPKTHIPYAVPKNYTYGCRINCNASNSYSVEEQEVQREQNGAMELDQVEPDNEALTTGLTSEQTLTRNEKSFMSLVLSWFFLWHLIWLSVMQLRHYLFIGTLNAMLNRLAHQDPDTVSRYTNAFAFTQLTGILYAPWNGMLMDRHKGKALNPGETEKDADLRSSVLSLFITAVQCLLFSICATVPVLPLQYFTFFLQVLNRSFLYGGNAAFINIAFPAEHFGKLYGLMMTLSAVVALLQYPCFALVKAFNGDPFYVNLMLTLLTLLAFIQPLNVFLHCRRLTKQRHANTQNTPQT